VFGLVWEHHLQTRILENWLERGLKIYTSIGFPSPGRTSEKFCFSLGNNKQVEKNKIELLSIPSSRTFILEEEESLKVTDVTGT